MVMHFTPTAVGSAFTFVRRSSSRNLTSGRRGRHLQARACMHPCLCHACLHAFMLCLLLRSSLHHGSVCACPQFACWILTPEFRLRAADIGALARACSLCIHTRALPAFLFRLLPSSWLSACSARRDRLLSLPPGVGPISLRNRASCVYDSK